MCRQLHVAVAAIEGFYGILQFLLKLTHPIDEFLHLIPANQSDARFGKWQTDPLL